MAYYGPVNTLRSNTQKLYYKIESCKQKAPYTQRLPLSITKAFQKDLPNSLGLTGGLAANVFNGAEYSSFRAEEPYAKAYAKFRDGVRGHVGTAANFAERASTIEAMTRRLQQMLTFTIKLRKGDFLGAGEVLGLNLKKRRSSKSKVTYRYDHKDRNGGLVTSDMTLKKGLKDFGNNYLEYHFGWEPLVKDIYEAISLIESPIRPPVYRGRATSVYTFKPSPSGPYDICIDAVRKTSVQVIANVKVENQSQLTLNQAGVINPFEVLWEVIPFSFIVDWFSNVSDVIGSISDFLGLSLEEPATTIKQTYTERASYYTDAGLGSFRQVYYAEKTTVSVRRTLGIATPKLVLKGIKLPSLTRGLTAISLLTLLLKEK